MASKYIGIKEASEMAFGGTIADDVFEDALIRAQKKQKRIYDLNHNPFVLDTFYLAELVSEAIKEKAFSDYTVLRNRMMA